MKPNVKRRNWVYHSVVKPKQSEQKNETKNSIDVGIKRFLLANRLYLVSSGL